eukprot:s2607_g8.t1
MILVPWLSQRDPCLILAPACSSQVWKAIAGTASGKCGSRFYKQRSRTETIEAVSLDVSRHRQQLAATDVTPVQHQSNRVGVVRKIGIPKSIKFQYRWYPKSSNVRVDHGMIA